MSNTAQEALHTCNPKYEQQSTKNWQNLSHRNEKLQGVESLFAISVAQPVKNIAAFVEVKGSVWSTAFKEVRHWALS